MTADLGFGVSVAGVADAMNVLQRVTGAIGQTEQATRRQGQAAREAQPSNESLGNSLQSTAARVAGMANAIQSLTSRLGSRDNSIGLVGSVASTVAQFSAMGAALGPGGAVAGAMVGLASSVRDLAAAHTEAAEAAAAQRLAEEQLASSGGIDTALRTGGDLSQYDDRARAVARQARLIRRSQAEVELATAENESSGILGILNGPGADIAHARAEQLRRDIEQIGLELRHLDDASAASGDATGLAGLSSGPNGPRFGVVTPEDANPTGLATGGRRARSGGGGGRGPSLAESMREQIAADLAEIRAETDAAYAEEADNREAEYEGEVQLAQQRLELTKQDVAARIAAENERATAAKRADEEQRQLIDTMITSQQAFDNGYVDSIDGVVEAYRRWERAARAAGDTSDRTGRAIARGAQATANSIVDNIGGTATSAFQSAVGAWLTGAESFEEAAKHMGEAIIQSLVSEAIVQTVVELARAAAAAASSYGTDPAVEMHLVAAGMWAGVGAVAGGIGAAAGAFGHAPGAGGKGATTQDAASASREHERSAAGGNSGPVTFTIMPGGFVTKSDVTAGVIDAMRHAARMGYTLPPGLIRQGA